MTIEFLSSPSEIRAALNFALKTGSTLDAAVAFVGRDWSDIVGEFRGDVRLICWLSSTNTNPHAVAQMLNRRMSLRQIDLMHAKVFLTNGSAPAAIVGSANLSASALAADDAGGQFEAATLIRDPTILRQIRSWFSGLWEQSSRISASDLDRAISNWDRRQRHGGSLSGRRAVPRVDLNGSSRLPSGWRPNKRLIALAREAAKLNPEKELADCHPVALALESHGNKATLENAVDLIASWTGHKGAYYPVYNAPPARVRQAFSVLFDRGLSLSSRLEKLSPKGSLKLPGIGLTAITLILSWRYPNENPPYDRRTIRFLRDFELDTYIATTLTPNQYAEWIEFAQDLSERLGLESAGQIDRLVWLYTRELDLNE